MNPVLSPARQTGRRWLLALSWLVFAASVARLGAIVFASPIVGYANNYDFVRPSSCVGIWQSDGVQIPEQPITVRPINALLYTGTLDARTCLEAADNVFLRALTLWHDVGDRIDYRELGAMRMGAALAVLLLLLSAVHQAGLHLSLNLAFFLSIADPTLSAYFNSLYQEASLLSGVLLACGCAAVAWQAAGRHRMRVAVLGGLLCVWIGMAKTQYLPFACAFALLMAAIAWRRWARPVAALALAATAILVPPLAAAQNDPDTPLSRAIRMANSTNTALWAVLPESRMPQHALRTLRLPPHCEAGIGKGWFTPGYVANNPCPEAVKLRRVRLLPLFAREPQTFLRPMSEAIRAARPFYPHYIGMFEDPADMASPFFQTLARSSMPLAVASLPDATYRGGMLASMLLGVLASTLVAVSLARRAASTHTGSLLMPAVLLIGLGGGTVLYALASSVFGDGYADFQKHAAGSVVGLAVQAAGLLALAGAAVSRVFARSRGHDAFR